MVSLSNKLTSVRHMTSEGIGKVYVGASGINFAL